MDKLYDFSGYKERFSASKQKITEVYQHTNKEIPFVVNYMNYWTDGELPDLIPDDYFTNPEAQTKFQLKKIKKHLDLIDDSYIPFLHPWFGTVVLPSALGCEIEMPQKSDPAIKRSAISSPEEISKLRMPDFEKEGLCPNVLATIDYMKDNTNLPVSVTDPQGPLNIALCLCGVENLFIWMYTNPDEVHELMDFCTRVLIEWIKVQKKRSGQNLTSGAWPHGIYLPEGNGGVWIADDDCTQLPADLYREFVVPYNSKVFKAFGGGVLHFCGSAEHQLENFLNTGGLTGINNFCMGNFRQIKEMQKLYENKIGLMVCDFTPFDINKYFADLSAIIKPKGTIIGSFVSPTFGLDEGKYKVMNRDGNKVSREVFDSIKTNLYEKENANFNNKHL